MISRPHARQCVTNREVSGKKPRTCHAKNGSLYQRRLDPSLRTEFSRGIRSAITQPWGNLKITPIRLSSLQANFCDYELADASMDSRGHGFFRRAIRAHPICG